MQYIKIFFLFCILFVLSFIAYIYYLDVSGEFGADQNIINVTAPKPVINNITTQPTITSDTKPESSEISLDQKALCREQRAIIQSEFDELNKNEPVPGFPYIFTRIVRDVFYSSEHQTCVSFTQNYQRDVDGKITVSLRVADVFSNTLYSQDTFPFDLDQKWLVPESTERLKKISEYSQSLRKY